MESLKLSLDLFAGCGGLTAGLHEAGLCKTLLANEFDPDAAEERLPKTYPAPTLTLFLEKLPLKVIFSGYNMNCWPSKIIGQRYPCRGEVDLICGALLSPMCQGFFSHGLIWSQANAQQKRRLKASRGS
jgi:site-specific DNA-cytosine methylase